MSERDRFEGDVLATSWHPQQAEAHLCAVGRLLPQPPLAMERKTDRQRVLL